METVYIRPGVVVEETWNSYFNELLTVPKFFYLLILQIVVLIITVWTLYSNNYIIAIAERKGHPSIGILLTLLIPMVLLPAFISYSAFREEKDYIHVWYALILYDLFFIIWIVSTLFEGIDQGIGLVMAFVFLLTVFWYTIVNKTISKNVTGGCIFLCILAMYLVYYSYQVL
jgi:hypothetical protein